MGNRSTQHLYPGRTVRKIEVQILVLAEPHEALSGSLRRSTLSADDSMIVNAFTNIVGEQAATAGA